MDVAEDQDLFWIAKEGLKAPLPAPWKPCQTAEEDIFYFNFETGESVWDHPCDEYYKKLFTENKQKKKLKKDRADPRGEGSKADSIAAADEPVTTEKKKKKKKKSSGAEEVVGPSPPPALPLAPPPPSGADPRAVPPLPGLGDIIRTSMDLPTARNPGDRPVTSARDTEPSKEVAAIRAKNGRELAVLEAEHTSALAAMREQNEKVMTSTRTDFNRALSRLTEAHNEERRKLLAEHERKMHEERKKLEAEMAGEKERMEKEIRREIEREVQGQRESLRANAQRQIEREILDAERSCREAELSVINGEHAREIERLVEEHCEAVRKLRQQQGEEIQRMKVEHRDVVDRLGVEHRQRLEGDRAREYSETNSGAEEGKRRREIEARLEQEIRPELERRLRQEMAPRIEGELRPRVERDLRSELEEINARRRGEIEKEMRHEIEMELKQSGEVVEAVRQDLRCELRAPIEEELRAALEGEMRETVEGEVMARLRRDMLKELERERAMVAELQRLRGSEKEVQTTVGEKDLSLRGSSVLLDLPDLSAISHCGGPRESRLSGDFEGILRILSERHKQLEAREHDAAEALSEKEERIAATLRRLHEAREQLTATEADATEKGQEIARLRRELTSREKITAALRDQVASLEAELQSEKRNAQASASEAMRELRRRQRVLDERETELEVKEIRQGEIMAQLRAKEAALVTERKRVQDDSNKLEAEAAEIATMQQTLKSITHEVKHAQEVYSSPNVGPRPMTSRPATDEAIITELGEIKSALVQLSARGSRPFGTRNAHSATRPRSDKATDDETSSESAPVARKEDGFNYWMHAEKEAIGAAKKRMAAEHAMCRAERSRLEMERQIWRDRMREAKRNGDHRAKGELMRAKSVLDARAADYNVSVAESQVESGKLEERERALEKYSASRMYREKRLNPNKHYWGEIPPPLPFSSTWAKYSIPQLKP
ncbi:hypothetical protein FOZ62_006340 [Perkinsus olseni]|uniref:WW domain-containing protein n=2 Tax=Perkinsus olseni TaxID=32597 RepID=A0A7J6STQ3_PEROL|nr:hypothetical protein FOZ62_006340 [Perkinsus olseni]